MISTDTNQWMSAGRNQLASVPGNKNMSAEENHFMSAGRNQLVSDGIALCVGCQKSLGVSW